MAAIRGLLGAARRARRPPGETTARAALRECAEETGLHFVGLSSLVYVGTYDTPGRDPRGPYVTTAYAVRLDHTPDVSGADDAGQARWLPVADLALPPLAFDHAWIVADAQHMLRRGCGPLVTAFAVVGCLLGALALIVLSTGLPLAIRYRRVSHQPQFPPYRPGPAGRRETDLRAHPEDAETQEMPAVQGD